MTKPDVLVAVPTRPKALAQLEAAYTLHRHDQAQDKPAFLAEYGPRCTAMVTNGHAALTRSDLEHLPNLRIVACSSAGYESIDVEALTERGVHFTNASDALLDDVADTALMLTLATRRHLVRAHAHVASGEWGRSGAYPLLSAINGKRAGIVGPGKIGTEIAKRFAPLKLQIGYTARSEKDVAYRYFSDLRALAAWSDILVAILPGGAETDNIIDRDVIEALGPTGTLINVARGSVIDEPEMIAALKDGRLGSAGLDVFWNEPDPDPALAALPNVTLYPHHASGTVETRDAMSQLVVDNLAAYFSGEPLLTPVNVMPPSLHSPA